MLLHQGGVGAWGLRTQETVLGRTVWSRSERERKALMRCSAAFGRCCPSWLWVCRLLPAHPAGLSPLSLCPLCLDVSIFSLKEIQLQKDPGYRGSAFQQSGRTGENHADLSQVVPRTALVLRLLPVGPA